MHHFLSCFNRFRSCFCCIKRSKHAHIQSSLFFKFLHNPEHITICTIKIHIINCSDTISGPHIKHSQNVIYSIGNFHIQQDIHCYLIMHHACRISIGIYIYHIRISLTEYLNCFLGESILLHERTVHPYHMGIHIGCIKRDIR